MFALHLSRRIIQFTAGFILYFVFYNALNCSIISAKVSILRTHNISHIRSIECIARNERMHRSNLQNWFYEIAVDMRNGFLSIVSKQLPNVLSGVSNWGR
jgi:hypothetical protein